MSFGNGKNDSSGHRNFFIITSINSSWEMGGGDGVRSEHAYIRRMVPEAKWQSIQKALLNTYQLGSYCNKSFKQLAYVLCTLIFSIVFVFKWWFYTGFYNPLIMDHDLGRIYENSGVSVVLSQYNTKTMRWNRGSFREDEELSFRYTSNMLGPGLV